MDAAIERIESFQTAPEQSSVPAEGNGVHNLALAAASQHPEDKIAPILERPRSKSMLLTIDIFKDSRFARTVSPKALWKANEKDSRVANAKAWLGANAA